MLERSPVSAGRRTLIFSLPADHHPASVVGTFNDWTPGLTLLSPAADGWISVSVEVDAASEQCFRYLGADGWWFDELDADLIDGRGSHVRAAPVPEVAAAVEPAEPAERVAPAQEAAELAEVASDPAEVASEPVPLRAIDGDPSAHRTAEAEPAPRRLLSPAAWAARKERRMLKKRAKRMRGDDATS